MTKCIQCNEKADIHINWLAKKSETENIPQEADICNSCMTVLWNGGGTDANGKMLHGSKHSQFGQTLTISEIR